MENRYYLAIDIGASSGRHILAHKKDGRIVLEEIYRFPNGMQEHNGHKVWNVDQAFWGNSNRNEEMCGYRKDSV